MSAVKEDLVNGQFVLWGAGGQILCRVLLGFLIVILSWLYYRRFMMKVSDYPTAEFAADVVVMIAYMALFLFIDWPAGFYSIIALIWLLYLAARILNRKITVTYFIFGLVFVAGFSGVALSAKFNDGTGAEWMRLILVTIAVVIYRPLDRKSRARLETS